MSHDNRFKPNQLASAVSLALALLALGPSTAQAEDTGQFMGLGSGTMVTGLSADGTVAIGTAGQVASRWSGGVMTPLGIHGDFSVPTALSADGLYGVMVGVRQQFADIASL